MSLQPAFAAQLRFLRTEADLTQRALASRAGYAVSTVRKLEAGTLRPSRQLAQYLARALALDEPATRRFLALARDDHDHLSGFAVSRSMLPAPATPLLGRDAALLALLALLGRPAPRLLTLTGAAGAGKSRVALELARRAAPDFRDGCAFVPLANLSAAALVDTAIGQALGLATTGAQPGAVLLERYLHDKQLLLVLDNFEHVLPAAGLVAALLAAAPQLRVLITSRAPLQLSGEHEVVVPPLAVPDLARREPIEALAQYPAVELFVQRVQARRASFELTATTAPAVAELCVRLDGLPLAIELAAAQARLFAPDALLRRLAQPGAIADGAADRPARQRSLQSAIAWSYDLLSEKQQAVFRQLGVCMGSWTLEAAQAVVDPALSAETAGALAELVNQSLVLVEPGEQGEPRFGMLETLRAFAQERLAAEGEDETTRERHAGWCCIVAESYAPAVKQRANASQGLDADYANIRAALQWTTERNMALGARIVATLGEYWVFRGLIREGRAWQALILARADGLPPELSARLRAKAAALAYHAGEWRHAYDQATMVLSEHAAASADRAQAELYAGLAVTELGDVERAVQHLERALAIAHAQDARGEADTLSPRIGLGFVLLMQGRLDQAQAMAEDSYQHARAEPSHWLAGNASLLLALIYLLRGNTRQGLPQVRTSVELLAGSGDITLLMYALLLTCVVHVAQDPAYAARLYGAMLRQAFNAGVALSMGIVAALQGQLDAARDHMGAELWEHAMSEGRMLSLSETIALALTERE